MVHKEKQKIIGWESPVLIHPGEHLSDFLEENGINQVELAERIGISKKAINEIVKGKSRITEKTAFRLSKVFSVSPEFWVNLQSNYDALLAKKEEEKKLVDDKENHLEKFEEAVKIIDKEVSFLAGELEPILKESKDEDGLCNDPQCSTKMGNRIQDRRMQLESVIRHIKSLRERIQI